MFFELVAELGTTAAKLLATDGLALFQLALDFGDAALEVVLSRQELGDSAAGELFDFVGLVAREELELDAVFDLLDGIDGSDKIEQEEGEQDNGDGELGGAEKRDERLNARMDLIDDETAGNAKGETVASADAAVEIPAVRPGIVPPFETKKFFHGPAGDVFEERAGEHSDEERSAEIAADGESSNEDE